MDSDKIKFQIINVLEKTKIFLVEKVFNNQNKKLVLEFLNDVKKSFINVVVGTKLPDKKGWGSFILHQVIINGAGWTAGILASDLVGSYFKTKSAKNLWGLKGRHDGKTMITKEEFEMYSWWASYAFGLIILILVRHFLIQTIEEYKKLRSNKEQSTSNN